MADQVLRDDRLVRIPGRQVKAERIPGRHDRVESVAAEEPLDVRGIAVRGAEQTAEPPPRLRSSRNSTMPPGPKTRTRSS
jgi:hypothetical protein